MPAARYPKEQMHRIRYTQLTPEQIQQKLADAAKGPSSASALSNALAGRSLSIVTDQGPTLRYRFEAHNVLSLVQDNGSPRRAGYGALDLKHLVLFSHLLPGTQTGLHVVIDQQTRLATVFEVWFSGYQDNREVQRQIYYGYVEVEGQPPPTTRHHITNRLQGKGLYWKQDNGVETLEFFPSVLSSSFVEITRFGGELTFCAPSDFIRISDELYLYSRVECEFSGTMTLYALDLFTMSQIGVRLGFDETDTLEYFLFRGQGEITGQLATFQPFGDNGETVSFGNRPPPTKKGERLVYRPLKLHPPMTTEEVRVAAQKKTTLFDPQNMMAGNRAPLSSSLVGKQLAVRCDGGTTWEYRFDELKKLHWRRTGQSEWHEEAYEAYEAAENLFLFSHLLSGAQPAQCLAVAIDLSNALSTCVHSQMGSRYMGNEVTQDIAFGVVDFDGRVAPRYDRHGFTTDLVGHAVTWNYSGSLTSWHVYSSPRSSSWTIFLPNGTGGLQWSSPCNYVKLRDDCYLFTWIEEACNGSQGLVVYNTRTMHDCGFSFYVDHNGLALNTIGAYARNAGHLDVLKYYGPKQR